MLWAQPDHLAFAVLEADDVESALQYVTALVPENWTASVLPVWNLPSQLRLIRQVRLATPTHFGEGLAPGDVGTKSQPGSSQTASRRLTSEIGIEGRPDEEAAPLEIGGPIQADAATPPLSKASDESQSPGTITRLLRELDAAGAESTPPEEGSARPTVIDAADGPRAATQIIEPQRRDPTPTATAWLVATAGPTKGKTFTVAASGATIGRLPEHEVYIPDERLSREHARIDYREGRYWLQDLGSMNGTALNGSLLSGEQPLQSGDTIELGSSKLVVTVDPTHAA
jgi:hypothetical protein